MFQDSLKHGERLQMSQSMGQDPLAQSFASIVASANPAQELIKFSLRQRYTLQTMPMPNVLFVSPATGKNGNAGAALTMWAPNPGTGGGLCQPAAQELIEALSKGFISMGLKPFSLGLEELPNGQHSVFVPEPLLKQVDTLITGPGGENMLEKFHATLNTGRGR